MNKIFRLLSWFTCFCMLFAQPLGFAASARLEERRAQDAASVAKIPLLAEPLSAANLPPQTGTPPAGPTRSVPPAGFLDERPAAGELRPWQSPHQPTGPTGQNIPPEGEPTAFNNQPERTNQRSWLRDPAAASSEYRPQPDQAANEPPLPTPTPPPPAEYRAAAPGEAAPLTQVTESKTASNSPRVSNAPETTGISGRVTDAKTSSPLSSINVSVQGSSGYWATSTDSSGMYTVTGLVSDTYRVQFSPSDNYASEWYNDKLDYAAADLVAIPDGVIATGIDAALNPGGQISGRLTAASSGDPLMGYVHLSTPGGAIIKNTYIDPSGYYTISAIVSGTYKLWFSSWGNYLSEWYNDKPDQATADIITVSAGATVAGIDAALSTGGQISGQLTAAGSGAPLAGTAELYSADGAYIKNIAIDTSGYYTISAIVSGSYKLEFTDGCWGCSYLSEWYNDKPDQATADPIAVADGATVTGIDAALSPGGKITGRLTAAGSGAPLAGVVELYSADGAYINGASIDASGYYTISMIVSGSYKLKFTDGCWGCSYFTEWYNDKPDQATADIITVSDGATIAGIDAALSTGGQISGRLTAASSGAPLAGTVELYSADGAYINGASIDASGYYTISRIVPGAYKLEFTDGCWGCIYFTEWYNDKPDQATADIITVADDVPIAGIDAALSTGGQISGRLSAADSGAPLAGNVGLYTTDGAWIKNTSIDVSGYYTISAIVSGTYKLWFTDGCWGCSYLSEWYNDKPDQATADTITVSKDATVTGIDAALSTGGKISGRLTAAGSGDPLAGYVELYAADGVFIKGASIDTSGYYTISMIVSGAYKLRFTDMCGGCNYLSEWYNNKPDPATADIITVSGDATTAGIDAALSQGGQITGRLTDAKTGQPIVGWASLFSLNGFNLKTGETDASGYYTITGIVSGTYKVNFSGNCTNTCPYLSKWYDNKPGLAEADPIFIPTDSLVQNINGALSTGGEIRGVVTAQDTGLPLKGVQACARLESNWWYRCANTDANGAYTLAVLEPNTYHIEFMSAEGTDYLYRWYSNKTSFASADPIVITGEEEVSGINAALPHGGRLAGKVTSESNGAPLAGVNVHYRPVEDDSWTYLGSTNAQGVYTSSVLISGYYYIWFYPGGSGDPFTREHIQEYYKDAATSNEALPIMVSPGSVRGGIDASLLLGGRITGRVTGDGGAGLAAVEVELYQYNASNGRFDYRSETTTDAGGYYTMTGLSSGEYYAAFIPGYNSEYVPEYYNDHPYGTTHDTFTVAVGATTTGIDAQLARGSQFSGQVTSESTLQPLANVQVNIYDLQGRYRGYGATNAEGQFTTWAVPPGEYRLYYWPTYGEAARHLSEYYNDAPSLDNADPILVAARAPATGRDAALTLGAAISGVVTSDQTGLGLADVYVRVCNLGYSCWGVYTNEQGEYLVQGLGSGHYTIEFETEWSGSNVTRDHAGESYNNQPLPASGDTLLIAAGENGIADAGLPRGGRIAGVVTSQVTHLPLSEVWVDVYTQDGWYMGNGQTNIAGEYLTQALPPGNYTLAFYPSGASEEYTWEYYDNTLSNSTMQTVTVLADITTAGIDAELDYGGWVMGQLMDKETELPISDAWVTLHDAAQGYYSNYYWYYDKSTTTDEEGRYTFQGVPGGVYKLRYWPNSPYAPGWYEGRDNFDEATPFQVTDGFTTTLRTATVEQGGALHGYVTDAGGLPLAGAAVYANGGGWNFNGVTDANGEYILRGLPPGSYWIEFSKPGYVSTSYDEQAVTAGAITEVTEAQLDQAGRVAGQVFSNDAFHEPINASLTIFDADGHQVLNSSNYSSNGTFGFDLPPGSYFLHVRPYPPYNEEYAAAYYQKQNTLATATPIIVTAGKITRKVYAALGNGGRIAGQVNGSDGQPAANVNVDFYNSDGVYAGYALSGADGSYLSPQLAPGDYTVCFSPVPGNDLAECYNNRHNRQEAEPVNVVAGSVTDQIDAQFETALVAFDAAQQTVSEATAVVTVAAYLQTPALYGLAIPYTVSGSALVNQDHTLQNGYFSFSEGQNTSVVTFTVVNDAIFELDETVILTLVGETQGEPGVHTVTIQDDETPVALPAPILETVSPPQGRNNLAVDLLLHGQNFTGGSLAYLKMGTARLDLPTTYVDSATLWATAPTSMTIGVYDVVVINPDGKETTLANAYRALSPLSNDLLSFNEYLWTSPNTVYANQEIELGLTVLRQGGEATLENVPVHFYLGSPQAGGTLIGSSVVASLPPNDQAATEVITWTTPGSGIYTLYAVIDQANQVEEINETNNQYSRKLVVNQSSGALLDVTPPVVSALSINSGAQTTQDLEVSLNVTGSDPTPGSGVAWLMLIEYIYSDGMGAWMEVQSSAWMSYTSGSAIAWTLTPKAGAHYIQAWLADGESNVSLLPQQTFINYLPAEASLEQGGSHYYLFRLAQYEEFRLTVTPGLGDADLYVWPPDFAGRLPWISASASEPDWVAFAAPVAGVYVARTYGYAQTTYSASLTAPVQSRAPLEAQGKTLLTDAGLASDQVPNQQRAVQPPATNVSRRMFLPLVTR